MIRRRSFGPGAFRLAATAAAGVLAGHFLGYRLVFPGSPQRHAVLIETGHGYLPVAFRFAAMLAVVAGATALASGYSRAKAAGQPIPSVNITTSRLALMQLSAFAGLEFFERLVSGVPLHHFLLPVLLVGALAQVAIAAVGAKLLELLYRAGEAASEWFAPACAAGEPQIWVPAIRRDGIGNALPAPRPIRGPPASLLS